MATWDSADLLQRCKRQVLRKHIAADEETPDADWYDMLTEAQAHWVGILAVHAPRSQYTDGVAITSGDNGVTYDLPSRALGRVELTDGAYGPKLGVGEFVLEGGRIRFPYGITRTFASGLYARYIPEPGVISAEVQPTLMPETARVLLVYHACGLWAGRGGLRDPAFYENLETNYAWDDSRTGKVGLVTQLKMNSGDDIYAEGDAVIMAPWWQNNPDLGNLRHRLS